jgi:hypothetical protein
MADSEFAMGSEVLPHGLPVEAADGTVVGTFEQAIQHKRENMLDGIVLRTSVGLFFVDAPEVGRMTNKRVMLTIDLEEVTRLPRYVGSGG